MIWTRSDVVDRGVAYSDWHCGVFVCARGYDELANKRGLPWTLFHKTAKRWAKIDTFPTLKAAQQAAEAL